MTETNAEIKYTFGKEEKLCHQKSIDRLFADGKSFIAYPLRILYFVEEEQKESQRFAKVLISVPKRKFKRANKRNRIKRQFREAYRLNKHPLLALLGEKGLRIDIAFMYLNNELPTYLEMEKSVKKAYRILYTQLTAGDEKTTN